jgi:hypothetical protein
MQRNAFHPDTRKPDAEGEKSATMRMTKDADAEGAGLKPTRHAKLKLVPHRR